MQLAAEMSPGERRIWILARKLALRRGVVGLCGIVQDNRSQNRGCALYFSTGEA